MLEAIEKYEKTSIATSILLIILSFFLIFNPSASLKFIVIVLGICLTVMGIVHFVSYFTSNREEKTISVELIAGTVFTIIGLFLIFKPSIFNQFLGIIVGAWLIIQFIVKFQFAFNLKSAGSPTWSMMLISSLCHLVIGLIMLFNPFGSAVALTTVAGVILLISEIGNIVESVYVLSKR